LFNCAGSIGSGIIGSWSSSGSYRGVNSSNNSNNSSAGASQGASSGGGITKSTVKREALPRGSVDETEYYADELGWSSNRATLTAGMKNFFNRTGVQPYLYITDSIDGSLSPTEDQVEAFASKMYDDLFSDEAHLLMVFFDYRDEIDRYHTWTLCGTQAKAVVDKEAEDILYDYIDLYYYQQNLAADEFFSKAFDDASKRIMTVTT
jgi:hypothetical protein